MGNAMPLTDLIRYFNTADQSGDTTLYLENGRAAAWHRGLRLGSLFRPIVDLRQEIIVGHQAELIASQADQRAVSVADAYAACETPEAIVHFDRLCRTLHALNFLAQQRQTGGYLQMTVHPRHLQAVTNQHGLVYEAILKRCGLAPQDIVLRLDTERLSGHAAWLADALGNYRQRGYRLALTSFDPGIRFTPDILQVSKDDALGGTSSARAEGTLIELPGIDDGLTYERALAADVNLGQGNLFGHLQADCRPTHDQHRVAYNSASSFGAPHENRQ